MWFHCKIYEEYYEWISCQPLVPYVLVLMEPVQSAMCSCAAAIDLRGARVHSASKPTRASLHTVEPSDVDRALRLSVCGMHTTVGL